MSSTASFRPDPESEAALRYLEVEFGMSRSEAIRRGLVELAERRRRAALAVEIEALARDATDRKEKRAITRLMDSLAPPPSPE
jgi:hypothetical protein